MDADAGVAGAGAARHEADARPAGQLAVGFGHECGPALLPRADQPHATVTARLVQRVEHRDIALARHAEDRVDAVNEQLIDQNLGAGTRYRNHVDAPPITESCIKNETV